MTPADGWPKNSNVSDSNCTDDIALNHWSHSPNSLSCRTREEKGIKVLSSKPVFSNIALNCSMWLLFLLCPSMLSFWRKTLIHIPGGLRRFSIYFTIESMKAFLLLEWGGWLWTALYMKNCAQALQLAEVALIGLPAFPWMSPSLWVGCLGPSFHRQMIIRLTRAVVPRGL